MELTAECLLNSVIDKSLLFYTSRSLPCTNGWQADVIYIEKNRISDFI